MHSTLFRTIPRALIAFLLGVTCAQAGGSTRRETSDRILPGASQNRLANTPFSASPTWTYAALGTVGFGSIVTALNGAEREIYTTAYGGSYWVALRHNEQSGEYDEIYVSPVYSGNLSVFPHVSSLAVSNVYGGPENEIVVVLASGQVFYHDQATKAVVASFDTAVTGFTALIVADVDSDTVNELVAYGSNGVSVLSPDGALEWAVAGEPGVDVVVAQMDDDPALEIATTGGDVIDCTTRAIQWTWPDRFGYDVDASDIDSDGRSELIVASMLNPHSVFAYDVERQLPKWSVTAILDYGGVTVADMDGDSVPEILYGEPQWGQVRVFDAVTLQSEGTIANPAHGTTNVAVGDVDGDGGLDVLWGAGYSSSGSNHLFVADWNTKTITWQSVDLSISFAGPVLGDLDGNGTSELVIVSWRSNGGTESGRILVFDARSHRLLALSPPVTSEVGDTLDVRLRNVDADAGLEILVASGVSNDGSLGVFEFDGATNEIDRIFGNNTIDTPIFFAIEAGDIDNDGQVEILGCGQGRVYVYDLETGAIEWISLFMGNAFGHTSGLELKDLDGNGAVDIVAMSASTDIHVFNGVTKQLDAVLFGEFSSLSLGTSPSGSPTFVAGTRIGELVTFEHTPVPNPYPYGETGRRQFIDGRVDGITFDRRGRVWITSNGVLTAFDAEAAPLWSEGGLGRGWRFGPKVAFLPHSNIFFVGSETGVVQFQTGTGFGQRQVGVYAASSGTFFERNSQSPGPADAAFSYGPGGAGFVALSGDWDGSGTDTPGLYDPATGVFFLRNSNSPGNADLTFGFGPAGIGWIPLVGDWNGDGLDTIGLFNLGSGTFFLRNSNSAGIAHVTFGFGPAGAGWLPIVGDWNGDGVDTIGLQSPSSSVFFLRNSNTPGPADVTFGYGAGGSGWIPVVGDWNGDGSDSIGLYDSSSGNFFLRNSTSPGGADVVFGFGPPDMSPVVGTWTGP